MTKILLGVPLFSLLFLVYARIRISTIQVDTNTYQVLAVSARLGKLLQLHRPSRVTSCLPDFVYRTVWLIPDSRLAYWAVYPCRNSKRSFCANAKSPKIFSSIKVYPVHSWPPYATGKNAALDCRETQNFLRNGFNQLLSLQLMGLLVPKAI